MAACFGRCARAAVELSAHAVRGGGGGDARLDDLDGPSLVGLVRMLHRSDAGGIDALRRRAKAADMGRAAAEAHVAAMVANLPCVALSAMSQVLHRREKLARAATATATATATAGMSRRARMG
jgi:hypothetical protein